MLRVQPLHEYTTAYKSAGGSPRMVTAHIGCVDRYSYGRRSRAAAHDVAIMMQRKEQKGVVTEGSTVA